MARKYSKSASKTVARAMQELKQGTLTSGGSGKTVKSRKQAIAIGLSEARRAGMKVPEQKPAKQAFATLLAASLTRYSARALPCVGLFFYGGAHPPYGVGHGVGF